MTARIRINAILVREERGKRGGDLVIDKTYCYLQVIYHNKDVEKFIQDSGALYRSVRVVSPADNVGEGVARNWAMSVNTQFSVSLLLFVCLSCF